MSYQLCQNCGSHQFEHIDGRLYCVICQSQNVSSAIQVSFANEGNSILGRRAHDQAGNNSFLDETLPKIEIFEGNQTIDRPSTLIEENSFHSEESDVHPLTKHVWTSYEVYSYILHIQLDAILALNYVDKEKHNEFLECTFLLYLRYLSSNGIFKSELSNLNEIYNKRVEFLTKSKTHIEKKSVCPINLDILIGLIHCSAMLIDRPITVKQLIDWINSNQLPYYNIQNYLPKWMRPTARDRFNLEKMKIHVENFFDYYQKSVRPILKPYVNRFLSWSNDFLYRTLMKFSQIHCEQVFFPFDHLTRPFFESICQTMVVLKFDSARRFLCTSLDFEQAALILLILLILSKLINDRLLDEFLQHNVGQHRKLFSYSFWLNHLNALKHTESIRDQQFYGRESILLGCVTGNQSKLRYQSVFSKVFQRTIHDAREQDRREIEQEIHQIRQILRSHQDENSLLYAFRTEEFFQQEFSQITEQKFPARFELIVHSYTPSSFSQTDKSELYETLLSLISGATITQVEDFYCLRQHVDNASTSRFPLHHLLSTLCQISSIPYNEHFHSFFSRFLKKFIFNHRLHHYFYDSPLNDQCFSLSTTDPIGTKQYGIDQLPVIFDLKLEQERLTKTNPIS